MLVMGRRQPPHFTDPKSPEFDAWASYDQWDAKALAERSRARAYPAACRPRCARARTRRALWDVDRRRSSDRRRSATGARRAGLGGAGVWRRAVARRHRFGAGRAARGVGTPAARRARRRPRRRYQPLPTTPAAEFDLALLVPDNVRGEQVEERDQAGVRKAARTRRTVRSLCWPGRGTWASEPRVEVDLPACRAHSTGS